MNFLGIKNLFRKRPRTLYQRAGGDRKLRQLVKTFYEIMSTDPAARECFATHQDRDISDSAEKLTLFLTGIMGGPQTYQEKFGHPRLRMRHFPFSIGEKEASQWLYCMKKAMEKENFPADVQEELAPYFTQVTAHLKNR